MRVDIGGDSVAFAMSEEVQLARMTVPGNMVQQMVGGGPSPAEQYRIYAGHVELCGAAALRMLDLAAASVKEQVEQLAAATHGAADAAEVEGGES